MVAFPENFDVDKFIDCVRQLSRRDFFASPSFPHVAPRGQPAPKSQINFLWSTCTTDKYLRGLSDPPKAGLTTTFPVPGEVYREFIKYLYPAKPARPETACPVGKRRVNLQKHHLPRASTSWAGADDLGPLASQRHSLQTDLVAFKKTAKPFYWKASGPHRPSPSVAAPQKEGLAPKPPANLARRPDRLIDSQDYIRYSMFKRSRLPSWGPSPSGEDGRVRGKLPFSWFDVRMFDYFPPPCSISED